MSEIQHPHIAGTVPLVDRREAFAAQTAKVKPRDIADDGDDDGTEAPPWAIDAARPRHAVHWPRVFPSL